MLLVLVALGVSVLVVATLMGLAFFDFAFREPQFAGMPPGKRPESRRLPVRIPKPSIVSCPSDGHVDLAVTAPEAIRAANYVRRYFPDAVGAVRQQAQQNLRAALRQPTSQRPAAAGRCPLMGLDKSCLAYVVRPLSCQGGCTPESQAKCNMGGDGAEAKSRSLANPEPMHDVPDSERELSRALRAAGLDGDLYDLNSALLTALDMTAAAERWVNGEQVFSNCRRFEQGSA